MNKIFIVFLLSVSVFSCNGNQPAPVATSKNKQNKQQTKAIKNKTSKQSKTKQDKQDKQNKQADKAKQNTDSKQNKQADKAKQNTDSKQNKQADKTENSGNNNDNSTKLPDKFAKILSAVPTVKLGKVKDHYYVSNETRYDLWYKYIKNLGGVYMGVGADQNYSLAAVANPELVILMDYDKEVVYLHKMYKIIVRKAKTPAEVLELLKRKHNKEIYEEAKKLYDERTAKWIKAIHKGGGTFILKHFKHRFRQSRKASVHFWLSDEKLYNKWRNLVLNNRVWEFPGDLTKAVTMNNISAAIKKMNMKMRVMYFSNAEEFWIYRKPFRQAIINMPFDDKSMIIRSVVLGKKFKIGWKFHYTVQKAKDFVSWMKYKGYFSIKTIARRYRIPLEGTKYLSKIPAAPEKPGKI